MTDRLPWSIAGAAVILRLAVAVAAAVTAGSGTLHAPDTSGYLEPAQELVRDGTFTRGGAPEIVRTPAYPLLLAAGVVLGPIEGVTIALQALLAGATLLAVYHLARELFGKVAAVTAAALYGLEPLAVLFTGKLLSETLFAACLTGSLLFLVRCAYRRPGHVTGEAALAGVLMGVATLTRPIAYPLLLMTIAALAWAGLRWPPPSGRRWSPVVWFALAGLALPLAWQARNAAVAGYGGLSAIVDVNAYFYHGAATEAARDGVGFYERQQEFGYRDEEVYLARHPEQRDWTAAKRFGWMGREGFAIVLDQPLTSAAIYLRGLARVALDPGGVEYLRQFGAYPEHGGLLGRIVDEGLWPTLGHVLRERPGLLVVEAVFGLALLTLYALAAGGVLAARPHVRVGAAACLTVAAFLFLASGGPQSLSRFRHPIMPVVCVFAGAGLMSWRAGGGARFAGLAAGGRHPVRCARDEE